MSRSSATAAVYDIKSADWPLLAFQLKSTDLQALALALQAQLQESPGFFEQDPVLLDLDALPEDSPPPDVAALCRLLEQHSLRPVAVKSARADWAAVARQHGLVMGDDARVRRALPESPQVTQAPGVTEPSVSAAPPAPGLQEALVLDRPLRSGQQFYAKDRDLIVLAMVNPGAEVLADGHIHIYAPLRGKAIAGARGFAGARIFAQSMDPELISIAGVYRTSEQPLPPEVRGRAAQVVLQTDGSGERLLITPLAT